MLAMLAAAILQTGADDTHLLRYTYAEGDKHVYAIREDFTEPDDFGKFAYGFNVDYEVTEVLPNLTAKLSVRREMTIRVVDGEFYDPPPGEFLVLTEERNPRGQVREREPFPIFPNDYARLFRLTDIVYPNEAVAFGDEWTHVVESDGLAPLVLEYTLVGGDEDVVRIEWIAKERDFESKTYEDGSLEMLFGNGWAEVSLKTGWPIRGGFEAINAPLAGNEIFRSGGYKIVFEVRE